MLHVNRAIRQFCKRLVLIIAVKRGDVKHLHQARSWTTVSKGIRSAEKPAPY